jgi:hypothetical protein
VGFFDDLRRGYRDGRSGTPGRHDPAASFNRVLEVDLDGAEVTLALYNLPPG